MRQIVIAAVVYCILNLFIPKLWERLMSDAPQIVINLTTFVAAIACLVFVACAGPVYERLKSPATNPIASTAIVALLAAAAIGAAWWIFAVPTIRSSAKAVASEPDETKPKGQSFMIDHRPGNCAFFTVDAPSTDRYLNNRKGLYVGDITVVNNTGGSTTLKEVVLAYDYPKEGKRELPGMVWPAGKLKSGEPALMLFWEPDTLIIPDWRDIRPAIAENKEKVPGAIWRGSSVFVFEPDIKSVSDVVNPRLVARDYLGQEAERPISPTNMTDWRIRNETFVQGSDDSIRWGELVASPSPKIIEPEVGPKNVPPRSEPSNSPPARVLANLTPLKLFALVEGHTPLQAAKKLAQYRGQWTEAQGELRSPVFPHGEGCVLTLHLEPNEMTRVGKMVECRFSKHWCEEIDGFKIKDTAKIRGKIESQNEHTLILSECELISPRRP